MPVDTISDDMAKWLTKWIKCRDAIGGQDDVKSKTDTYLLKPSGMVDHPEMYAAFLSRANYPSVVARTIEIAVGHIFRKDPQFFIPDELLYLNQSADIYGTPLLNVLRKISTEVLSVGRHGVLVDMAMTNGNNKAVMSQFNAENIINVQTILSAYNYKKLSRVVLKEQTPIPTNDVFVPKYQTSYRELFLDKSGHYSINIHTQNDDGDWFVKKLPDPVFRKKRLDFIPFQLFSSTSLHPEIEKPPLLDLINLTFSWYLNSADYEHSLFQASQPTPVVIGLNPGDDIPETIGSSIIWALPMGSDVKYLEVSGAAFEAQRKAMEDKQQNMIALGAKLLETRQRRGNVGENVERLQQMVGGDSATLTNIANTISQGVTKLLQWIAWWGGNKKVDEIAIQLNLDFMPLPLSGDDIKNLKESFQDGSMSWDSYVAQMQQGDILSSAIDPNTEQEKINKEALQTMPIEKLLLLKSFSSVPTFQNELDKVVAKRFMPEQYKVIAKEIDDSAKNNFDTSYKENPVVDAEDEIEEDEIEEDEIEEDAE